MAIKKTKNTLVIDSCPGCGGTRTSESRASIELESGYYEGRWITCDDCGLQGPKKVWSRMVTIRSSSNGHSTPTEVRHQAYRALILSFGVTMFKELVANDAEKGDFLKWLPTANQAGAELEHHFIKLIAALSSRKRRLITEHCADLANVAMAIDRSLGKTT